MAAEDHAEIVRNEVRLNTLEQKLTWVDNRQQEQGVRVGRNEQRIDHLESVRDQAMGAAREAAHVWAKVLAGIGAMGVLAQLGIYWLTRKHG